MTAISDRLDPLTATPVNPDEVVAAGAPNGPVCCKVM
jgi:hypothetical protein